MSINISHSYWRDTGFDKFVGKTSIGSYLTVTITRITTAVIDRFGIVQVLFITVGKTKSKRNIRQSNRNKVTQTKENDIT